MTNNEHGGPMTGRPARTFRKDISDPESFVVTLELVPGEQSRGRSVDTVMAIAESVSFLSMKVNSRIVPRHC